MSKNLSHNDYLKMMYTETSGIDISERTWYRIKKKLKEVHPNIDSDLIFFVGKAKKSAPNIPVDAIVKAFKLYKKVVTDSKSNFITGKNLYNLCVNITVGKPDRSTIFRWFKDFKKGYVSDEFYTRDESIIVIGKAYNYLQREN